jgi:CRISPR-associated protein Csm5
METNCDARGEADGMKYRLTCLTPTLIGDGQRLAPIDYMVWKDHVNVLDQRRIFKLLAKGPRLEGYLAQLKKAERLDFADWGGFAQNFAGRRIPFEHSSSIAYWERAKPEQLFIPTFAVSPSGPYVPGTAIKGALRTGAVHDRWSEATMRDLANRLANDDRPPRNPATRAEEAVLGGAGSSRMRRVAAGDSASSTHQGMKVYLMRIATLVAKGPEKFEVGWKSGRGTVDTRRIDDSTPMFIEMASPGASFEGVWQEKSVSDRAKIFNAANKFAAAQLAKHKQYAASTGLSALAETVGRLETKVEEIGRAQNACVVSIGWGGGLVGKSSYLETTDESYRQIMKTDAFYRDALRTGMPFPKTRKIIFEGGKPASLPGWVLIETV